jgi:methylmalonyl-CoA mutase cobalamin-binding subunit
MQWAAKTSLTNPSLLALFPSHYECKNWTLSALRAKGCDVDEHGAVIEVTGKVVEEKKESSKVVGRSKRKAGDEEVAPKKRKAVKKSN